MLWTNTKRVCRSGFVNFWRNGFVSLSSVLVMVITLFAIGSTVFSNAMLKAALGELEGKLDITVYFAPDANPSDISSLQDTISKLPEVQSVTYTSSDQALADFTARHQNDQLVLQSLQELSSNPLTASLTIKAKDPAQYQSIVTFLNSDSVLSQQGSQVIDNIARNQSAIDKLTQIIKSSERAGFALTIILAAISILIAFNTIRLTIYISRDEIGIMRLVGAETRYIRGPFVVTGVLYGLLSGILTMVVFYPITYWLRDVTSSFFTDLDLFTFYVHNFGQVFALVVGSGMVLGAFSSWLAVRRYLKE